MKQTQGKKADRADAAPRLQPVPVPDWVDVTPEECEYTLQMDSSDGESIQSIDLTRVEFLNLKRHLSAARGYEPTWPKLTPQEQKARSDKAFTSRLVIREE